METNLNSAGYDLIEVGDDNWALLVKGTNQAILGNFKQVVKRSVESLGFKLETFNMAIEEFIKNQRTKGHDAIHFGMHRSLLFTFKKGNN